MLWKLSLTGLKSRFKDYAVLFSGLTLAAAIFYMFMTIAINPAFLKGSMAIAFSITQIVFIFGIALLAIITLVYIVYANSFLLSMRKKDYGTYMILGARNSKIGRLIFTETVVIGLLATALGILIGIGLTQVVSQLLISQLGLQLHKFLGFYLPAILWTVVFFVVLFFLAAIWNRHKLVSTSVIKLLHEDQKPVKLRNNRIWKATEVILGLALLAIGYWAMWDYHQLQIKSVEIGFVTILAGSYFVFDSVFTTVINALRKNKKFKYSKLHSFTLGQLKFRLGDYNRVLTVISLLFALALGAITVGLNFNNMTETALQATYYDAVLYKRDAKVNQQLKKVAVRKQTTLNYKVNGKKKFPVLYVTDQEIAKKKIKFQSGRKNGDQMNWKTKTITVAGVKNKKQEMNFQLASLTPYSDYEVKVVTPAEYVKIPGKNKQVTLLLINNFRSNFNNIEKLQKMSLDQTVTKDAQGVYVSLNNSKSAQYRLVASVASGFEFMGFFLGLAFLAMLASTLMFKVLSGANSDRPRYEMLWKVGSRRKLLKSSIKAEIGTLFALPAVLGVIDVLFGLQFFKGILANPYDKIWIPFTIFLVLYLLYYLITVKLYEGIVLKK